jgi:hypothetical protein
LSVASRAFPWTRSASWRVDWHKAATFLRVLPNRLAEIIAESGARVFDVAQGACQHPIA